MTSTELKLKLSLDSAQGETQLKRFNTAFDTMVRGLKGNIDTTGLRKTFAAIESGKTSVADLDAATRQLYKTFAQGRKNATFLDALGINADTREINAEVERLRSGFNSLKQSGTASQTEISLAAAKTRERIRELRTGLTDTVSVTQRFARAMRVAQTALALFAGGSVLARVFQLDDGMDRLRSRLEQLEGGSEAGEKALQRVAGIANAAGVEIAATGASYTKYARAVRLLGGSSQDAADFTEALALSLKISGASGEEATATMYQLGQSMQKGKLDGDEFRTVAESGGRILEYLADALGVTRGELQRMSAAGELSADKLLKLIDKLEDIRKEAGGMASATGEAFMYLRNKMSEYAGESTVVEEASNAVAGSLRLTCAAVHPG